MKSALRALAAVAVVIAASGAALAWSAGQDAAAPAAGQAAKAEAVVPFIGNATCPMKEGKKVNPAKYVEADGQRVYFCCGNCEKSAKADPKAALAAAYKEAKPAGNKTCPVSGHPIEAAKSKSVTFMGHSIALCCGDCEAGFKKEPYVMAVCAVYGVEDLKNANCPVMQDEKSAAEDLIVYKGKLVRLCCADCPNDFKKDPDKYLAAAAKK